MSEKYNFGVFGIRHTANKKAFIKQAVLPPRLSEWTEDVNEAQIFDSKAEAEQNAQFIKDVAFNVEVFDLTSF